MLWKNITQGNLYEGHCAFGDREATPEEIEEWNSRKLDPSILRAAAYREESDPLFFKEQRGEVTSGTWNAKVEEIRKRFPK
ncbi:MAG TPA: hypothetical protein VGK09_08425 [Rhodocyclaceae bacterium]|jgi:hypothetical protein